MAGARGAGSSSLVFAPRNRRRRPNAAREVRGASLCSLQPREHHCSALWAESHILVLLAKVRPVVGLEPIQVCFTKVGFIYTFSRLFSSLLTYQWSKLLFSSIGIYINSNDSSNDWILSFELCTILLNFVRNMFKICKSFSKIHLTKMRQMLTGDISSQTKAMMASQLVIMLVNCLYFLAVTLAKTELLYLKNAGA